MNSFYPAHPAHSGFPAGPLSFPREVVAPHDGSLDFLTYTQSANRPTGIRNFAPEDWIAHKKEISRLYNENTLQHVRSFIRERYGLDATAKQYKDRIKKWALDKRIKTDEMEAIIRKQRERALTQNKASAFRVRNRPVEQKKIDRFIHEHPEQFGSVHNGVMDTTFESAATPACIEVYTPAPTEPLTPSPESSPNNSSINCTCETQHGPERPCWYQHDNAGRRILGPPSIISNPELFSPPTSHRQITQDQTMTDVASWNQETKNMAPGSMTNIVPPPAENFTGQNSSLTPKSNPDSTPRSVQSILTPICLQSFTGDNWRDPNDESSGSDNTTTDARLQTELEVAMITIPEEKHTQGEEDELRRELREIGLMYGKHHSEYLAKTTQLAENLVDRGKVTLAGDMLDAAILDYKMNNRLDVHLFTACNTLGQILHAQQFHSRAEEIRTQAVQAAQHCFGPENLQTLMTRIDLILTYNHLGRLNEAEALGLELITTCNNLLGKSHPASLTALYNLSHTYGLQKRYKDTEDTLTQVIVMRIGLLQSEKDPVRLKTSTQLLAVCLAQELVKVYQGDTSKD